MMQEQIFAALFGNDADRQNDALYYIEKQIQSNESDVDVATLVTFALARPMLTYKDQAYNRMRAQVMDENHVYDPVKSEEALYLLPPLFERARTLISKLKKPPKKLEYRTAQEYIRYVCENGSSETITKLIELTYSEENDDLYWTGTRLRELPQELLKFPNIKNMNFILAYLKSFPAVLLKSTQLEKLKIYSSKIETIPGEIKNLKSLQELELEKNIIKSLPDEIGELSNLKSLDLSNNKLTELPVSMAKLDNLASIKLTSNPMTSTTQVQKLFKLFYEKSIPYSTKKVFLHLIFARIKEAIALNDTQSILEALNIPLTLLQDNAMLALDRIFLSHLENNPLKSGSCIYVCGKISDMDSIKNSLQKHDIAISTKPDKNSTHLLIGKKPKFDNNSDDSNLTYITPNLLQEFLQKDQKPLFENPAEDSSVARKNINELILSDDANNHLLALEMVKSLGVSHDVLAHLYYLYRVSSDKNIRNISKDILLHHASPDFIQTINKKQSFGSASEIALTRYLNDLEKISDIDAIYFAKIVFMKTGLGINYLFSTGDSDNIRLVLNNKLDGGTRLNLRYSHIKVVPEEIGEFTDIEMINLEGNEIKTLPESFGNLNKLKQLYLKDNKISSLPVSFSKLVKLETLELHENKLRKFPDQICALSSLQNLHIHSNNIKTFPADIENLTNLQLLQYGQWDWDYLPVEIFSLTSLTHLIIRSSNSEAIEKNISSLKNLIHLEMRGPNLPLLPKSICKLAKLQELDLQDCSIQKIPDEISELKQLKVLNLHSNQLTEFPISITRVASLQELTLGGNTVEPVPNELSNLNNLKKITVGYYGNLSQKLADEIKELVPEGCEVE